jgi:hypothetical protein
VSLKKVNPVLLFKGLFPGKDGVNVSPWIQTGVNEKKQNKKNLSIKA